VQQNHGLQVALGDQAFGISAPWGEFPVSGKVTDVAAAPDGTVFVLTRRDCRTEAPTPAVHMLAPGGALLASFGAELLDAHKLVVGPDGLIWVVDRDAHEIVAFDRAGRILRRLGQRHAPGAPFSHPADLGFLPDGRIVVADGYAAGCIHIFDAEGRRLGGFGSVGRAPGQFLVPHAVGILSDGRIVVADRENGRVQIFTEEGRLLALHDFFMRPQDVWIDGDDTILVSDSIPTLTRITAGGTSVGRCRTTLNGPHGFCGAPSGAFYMAENNPSRVTCVVPDASGLALAAQ